MNRRLMPAAKKYGVTVLHIQDNDGASDGHMLPFTQLNKFKGLLSDSCRRQAFCVTVDISFNDPGR